MLVVTAAPAGATAGTAYPGVSYNSDIDLLFSEIDPVQNNAVSAAVNTAGFSETMVWSGQPGGCGNPSSSTYQQCYPPAVNYSPLYYLINGVGFNKTNASASLFAASNSGASGTVLARLVNAGLRMHVPSIVGAHTGASAVPGISLIAEDGNPLPGIPRVQNEVFMAPGKTYDVKLNVPAAGGKALPVFDRQLSLSGNATQRDSGMLAYIGVNGALVPTLPSSLTSVVAKDDSYTSVIPGQTLTVSDPSKGVIANDTNVYGVKVGTAPTKGTLTLNADGTFTYVPGATWTSTTSDTFTYQANGTGPTATVTLGAAPIESGTGIVLNNVTYTSNLATSISIKSPGVLAVGKPIPDSDAAGYPLTVAVSSIVPSSGLTVSMDKSGGFSATVATPGTYTFTYQAQNSQGTLSASAATVTLIFPTANGPHVTVVDGATKAQITPVDYRWIIEEDRTFYVDPTKTTNNGCGTPVPPGGCTSASTFSTNFHTSFMPVVAQGCVGTVSCEAGQTVLSAPAVCDIGNGVCRAGTQQTAVDPSQVHLDPTKRYYISVLNGDAANPFETGNASSGHGMGGAPIAAGQTNVTVIVEPTPLPPSRLTVFVFEDDNPLNGEQDAGGGVDILAPNEPGLGGFNVTIFDDAGGSGDATGQVNYDMFNQPLSNSLAGTIDPATKLDACPISKISRIGVGDPNQTGITGTIITCPRYEGDGSAQILSPLAGQAVIANMMPGRYGIVATPAADRIARGEEWLQTNTLDGQKAHDAFLKVGEPSFFQEYGPASFHVVIGFANPKIINSRLAAVCNGTDVNVTGTNCTNSVDGLVTMERMSRTPDERLYSSGDYSSWGFTQCFVSIGDPDGEDFAFTKCDGAGHFSLSGLPDGNWRITVFDQWNDMLVDGLSTPVSLGGGNTTHMGDIAINQWQSNIYTSTYFDQNGDGLRGPNEPGLALVPTNIRFRDGSFSNFNNTDLSGNAGFNEVFPLFNWYVVETDTTRYKNTGTHVVYDAGGPADGSASCGSTTNPGYPPCGSSDIGGFMANTTEQVSLPADLRVPGAVYCANADCTGSSIANGPITGGSSGPTTNLSTGRIDPPWVLTYGWQGFSGQNNFLEFGKTPYNVGENGGIKGHVVYASTRPFDDPQLLLQLSWEPLVPNVTINLYQEGTAPDGSQSLKLVDTTTTSSFDDWAQGFRSDGKPNMNCPGQSTADLFYFSIYNQPMYLDLYYNGGTPVHTIPYNSQFKCYDGMHNWNQLQPAPYDGMYQFPSVTSTDPATGKPLTTNCTGCVANPSSSTPGDPTYDPFRHGLPMLPAGKYVVEVVVPPGYELVKEEDKNILIGDNFIAPVTVQFPGLGGGIFIIPDQAAVGSTYNANNAQNPTTNLGSVHLPRHEGDTGTIETYWPCVGASRIVPDFISLFPGSAEVAPFAGATRNLCDRKEVTLDDQTSAMAKFYVFTSTHVAAHFTGVITDDFTSEFDPFSPQFGEKFAPPDLPVSVKDWAGNEVNRVYADHWGGYNGLNYSTWEVNPPNPTGYSPTMMVMCMNDPGNASTPDPLFNPGYSQFCYELPFMPGQTQYMDTPVTPTSAFSEGYNHPDCSYPDATPAVSEVDGDGVGPYVSAAGNKLTIKALGDQVVQNNAYSGPSATTAPFNAKTVTRHYGFGATQGTGTVTIGGKTATVTGWSDTQITVNVPTGVANCAVQQQAQYGGPASSSLFAKCGQLVITAGNGKQSIDAVTVTIGGKAPTVMTSGTTIQGAIDGANPGDLIIVPPGLYNEFLLMWKPVRLQGVGAASSVINANTHPAGRLDPWRRQVNCLFGLALNGQPATSNTGSNPYDSTGTYTCGGWPGFNGGPNNPQVDRLPLEGILGWDTTVNGNLAQLLQEPTLMGAYEGAGITVLGKGVRIPVGSTDIFGSGSESAFPTGTTLLTANTCRTSSTNATNPFPSNFQCNPSAIDGLAITDASQGGGGIFVHAWGHNLQIANNRIYNNSGTLTGGITIGQGESPDAYLQGDAGNTDPGSCQTSSTALAQLPYCFDLHVNVHNNAITLNSSIGDELFSSTPAGAGGVTFCTGADFYQFNYNWVCGNLSTGDGGGVVHLGYIYNGDIEHNTIIFNQSTNPTVPTNGGGLLAMGAPPDGLTAAGLECGNTAADADCTPGLSDGTGPGLVINANLIMGNAAESGSGGGLRFQNINGTEVIAFPRTPAQWNSISVTNNIIANNVAGWDGAGVSMQDALVVNLINNTIMSNDTTASAGVLFNTLGAPIASSQGTSCVQAGGTTKSCPQPAGLVTMQHSAVLAANMPPTVTCPAGHAAGTLTNGTCKNASYPLLANDVFWQNRAFYVGVGALSATYQQNIVTLYNAFSNNPAATQPVADATGANGSGLIITGGTGACVTPTTPNYWDIGVRGDTGPTNHSSGITLSPAYSVLTNTAGYSATALHNTGSNPTVVSQYCNGSRTPPEFASMGYQVPPGIADAQVPNPVFTLTPSATVDEGNNWVNISWGPLAETHPLTGAVLGNYAPAAGSPVINYIPSSATTYGEAPNLDFFGTSRKTNNAVDAGAVEFVGVTSAVASVTGGPLSFGSVATGTTSAAQTLTLHNTGNADLTGITVVVTAPFSRAGGTCGTTLTPAAATCTITVVFSPTAIGAATGTATITGNVAVTGSPVSLSGTGIAATAIASVTGGPLAFGNVTTGTNSATQTLTLHNTGTANLTGITVVVTTPFSRVGGTCTATLAPGTCTITVRFSPTVAGGATGTATITASVAVTGSPVGLSGTGVAPVIAATLTPTSWTTSATRGVTLTGPAQLFTLTNTGNVTLTGILQGALGGTNAGDFFVLRALSTCGPAGGGQILGQTTLAPGATCGVTVQFRPLAADPAGSVRHATISVSDAAGTQTSTMAGTAN
jgi:hypothetical protein